MDINLKKHISVPLPAALLILIVLTISLSAHYFGFLHKRISSSTPLRLAGSYCTEYTNESITGEYLVFTPEGFYVRYDQTTLLEQGSYAETQEGQYVLTSGVGEHRQLLQLKNYIYLFDGSQSITQYTKFDSAQAFIGNWSKDTLPLPTDTP